MYFFLGGGVSVMRENEHFGLLWKAKKTAEQQLKAVVAQPSPAQRGQALPSAAKPMLFTGKEGGD